MDGAGWAPKGGALLVADLAPDLPTLTVKTGAGTFDTQPYETPSEPTLVANIDRIPASSQLFTRVGGFADTSARAIFPIQKGAAPTKLTATVAWTAKNALSIAGSGPASVHATATVTATATDTTKTIEITTGGTRL